MTKKLKRLSSFLLVLTLLISIVLPIPSHATYNDEIDFNSKIVYMESLDQGTVIFNKNANKKTPMASLAKIATAAVVLDNVKNLDEKVTVTQAEIDEISGTNSLSAGLQVGEVVTVRQLLSLMLIQSANEACVILAHHVAGSTPKFVKLMNDMAKKLGCKNTHFKNPHGLDTEGQYTTAKDLSLITKHALKNDDFKKMVSTEAYTLEATNKRSSIKYYNTNMLIRHGSSYYYKPCKGIKTGTSKDAGSCLVSYATKNGYSYLCIIMQAPPGTSNDGGVVNTAFNETYKAYQWVFNNIKLKVVADPTDVVTVIDVHMARKVDHVRLVPKEEVTALIPANVDASGVSLELKKDSLPKKVKAPVSAGENLGKANVLYAKEVIGTVDLMAADSVHLSILGSIAYYIKAFFGNKVIKIISIFLLLCLALKLGIYISKKQKSKRNTLHLVSVKHDVNGTKPVRTIKSNSKSSRQPRTKHSKNRRK